jgi:hypothetical protein
LTEAYRHKRRSAYADAVIANQHADYLPAECVTAVDVVLAELWAEQISVAEERSLMDAFPSAHVARLHFLNEPSDDEFSALRRTGLLDDLEL